jgi:regulator of protease activity HflC (stomatin/prohibitin superfamily)
MRSLNAIIHYDIDFVSLSTEFQMQVLWVSRHRAFHPPGHNATLPALSPPGKDPTMGALGSVVAVVIVLLILSVRMAQEYQRAVIFRLGRLKGHRGPGLYLLIPLVERRVTVDLRTITQQLDTQETLSSDGVAVKVNAVLWYRAADPERTVVSVENWQNAVKQAAETGMRDTIGQSELDGLLRDRLSVNARLLDLLRNTVRRWGVEIEAVELKDLDIPEQMQRAIAREAEAIREKRARIIKAEGEMEAAAKLTEAAKLIGAHPAALEIRRLQTISEVGAEHNSTTVLTIPGEFLAAASAFARAQYGVNPAG